MKKHKINILEKIWKIGVGASLLMTLFLSTSSAAPVKIMPLGDSITHENYRDANITTPEANRTSYRDDLLTSLTADNYSIDFVGSLNSGSAKMPDADHEGHNGIEDGELAAGVEANLTANPAEIVLLHIGTNGDITDEDASDVNTLLDNIDTYEQTNATHVKVVLARIINCWEDWNNTAAGVPFDACTPAVQTRISNFNNNIDTMVATRIAAGDDITVVDMENGAGFDYNASDMIDDLHPNDTGYAKMAVQWHNALKTVIPTHQWKLDEAATPYVDDYRANNGILVQNSPTPVAGQIGGAQAFVKSAVFADEIAIPDDNSSDWTPTDDFTLSLWVNTTQVDPGAAIMLGRNEAAGNAGAGWYVGTFTNDVAFVLRDSNGNQNFLDTLTTVNDGNWHHIVAVRKGSTNQNSLYIDGIHIITDTNNTTFTGTFASTATILIGNLTPADNFDFNGSVDEVTTYDGALDANQVKQLFTIGQGSLSIVTTPVTTATVGQAYSYDVNSSDEAATAYSLTTNPAGMSIDGDGIISWTPADMVNAPVTVEGTDGTNTANQSFTVQARISDILPASMIHYWKLDENDPADKIYLDAFDGATDATCAAGCPTQEDPGQVDEAQLFAANSDLSVPDDDSFDLGAAQSFTVAFWIKPDNSAGLEVAIGRHPGASGNDAWWVGRDGTKVQLSIGEFIQSVGDIDDTGNVWTHITVVKDVAAGQIILYVNGLKDSNETITATSNFTGTEPVKIGWFDSSFKLNGALDDIAIFDSALNDANITQNYQNGLAGKGYDNPDTTPPVITRTGPTPVEVIRGSGPYIDAGAEATDDVDGNITANIVIGGDVVDVNTVGEYNVTYNVSDAAGNAAVEVVRTVNVVDKTIPVITRLGVEPASVVLGTPYVDAGASATDDVDGNITANIVTGGDVVDVNTLGQYIVTYNVSDAAGNAAVQVTRTVNVVDAGTPVITLLGTSPVEIFLGTAYVDAGATATDDVDGDITANIVTVNPVDTNTLGEYNVTYNVSDNASNPAVEVIRTVRVIADNVAPVITLLGTTPVTLEQGTIYTDAGATALDNVDGTITANIITVNPVDTNTVGQYTVTYNVSDAAGNAATEVTRTVNVTVPTPPTDPDWLEKDGNTYSVGSSSVEVDPALGVVVVVTADKVTFTKTDTSGNEIYIDMLSDGTIKTGYRQGGVDVPTATTAFAPGTKATIVEDNGEIVIIIDAPLTTNLTFGGK